MANFDDILKSLQTNQNIGKALGLNSRISEIIKTQKQIEKSYLGLSMMSEISKNLAHQSLIAHPNLKAITEMRKSMSLQSKFLIPNSAFDAIESISRQHKQLLASFTSISEAIKFHQPPFSQINNLHFALGGISGQIAGIAAQQKNWTLLSDFEEITEQAIEFSNSITVEQEENQKREFQILLTLVFSFLNKHKKLGISALIIIDIVLRFAGIHQYYDFIKEKPELATKTEINKINSKQDSISHFIQLISEELKQVNEYRITNCNCEVRLKPKSKSFIISKIPKGFELVVLQIHHKWILVSFFDPKDKSPLTGWVMKKYLDKPKSH